MSNIAGASAKLNSTLHNPQPITFEGFGEHVFRGAVAAPYLEKQGLPTDTLESPAWAVDGRADQVCEIVSITFPRT
ncbi:hypothetical protein EON64_17350 [archaeon]|nr:MAG: hypothetical protein EON64_17350 [archaeon]